MHGAFYLSQEDVALWRYGAEPGAGTARTQVDAVGPRLTADIEGLTIYYRRDGTGYLVASGQGDDSFAASDHAGIPGGRFRTPSPASMFAFTPRDNTP